MILFLTALREEREAVRESWGLEPAGTLGGLELEHGSGCVHLCAGIGSERMVKALELGCRVYRPKIAVLVGFSAGLLSGLDAGRLVVDERSDQELLAAPFGRKVLTGRVATCGYLQTSSQKRTFAEKHPEAPVADLESEAFLAHLPGGVRGLVMRAVSDAVDFDLPLDFSSLTDDKGFPNIRAIAMAVARKPFVTPQMMRLARDSKLATAALADALLCSRARFKELDR